MSRSERPYFEYSLPPNFEAGEPGPWVAAGCVMLLNLAVTLVLMQGRRQGVNTCVLVGIMAPGALLAIGLIAGSNFCRWVALILTVLAHALMLAVMFVGWPIPYPVEPTPVLVCAQAMSLFGWVLMLTPRPGGAKSLLGIVLVLAASGVAFWSVPITTW
jgi:hypothetical protein